jgi:hypothetical protein
MKMTKMMRVSLAALFVLLALPCGRAQEKQAPPASSSESAAPPTAFRVQVVLAEYDGTNKISSLPYTIPVATLPYGARSLGSLRVGIRVPVPAATKTGESSFQYIDIGSNLDVRISRVDADRYALELTIERSSLYVRGQNKDGKAEGREWMPGDPSPDAEPLVRDFRGNLSFVVRDGHPAEATVATDPVTGHVMKVETVLTVLK